MIKISRKMQLALEAVVDIAYNARPDPVQSKEITRRQGVPQRYLEQVMQQLVHAGILKGVRGPRGGYRLAKERRRITVADIVRIVMQNEPAEDNDAESSSELNVKVIRPLLEDLQTQFLAALDEISIEDLCTKAKGESVAHANRIRSDFII